MGLRVLVIDDSAAMRKIVRHCLAMAGWEPELFLQAGNGQEGLDIMARQALDLVFVDINMPVMDGLAFLEKIKQHPEWSGVAVAVVSSETSRVRIRSLEDQGILFLHKPFTPEELARKIAGRIKGEGREAQ